MNENVYSRITDTSIGYQYDRAKQYFVSLATPWYTVPGFNVDKCNVVKACCYDKNGKRSNTVTKIYFVGFAEKEGYDNLNIMSIVCSPNDLFDYENGIYVCGKDMDEYLAGGDIAVNWAWWKGNYSRRHRNGERLATAVLFNTEGEIVFDKQIGVRIQGNSSRALMPKNLNLFSRIEYDGSDRFPDVFGDGYKAHGLNLFMGSQDYCTKVRDAVVNDLSSELDICTRTYMPVALFLNGEYWGVYFITQKYDEEYFEYYYQSNRGNITVIRNDYLEEGERKYLEQYRMLLSFISDNDMSDDENYRYVCENIDIKSLCDYYAMMIYTGRNNDWPKGNIGAWRVHKNTGRNVYQDGKWRFLVFDMNSGCLDISFLEEDSIQYVLDNDLVFSSLCKNNDFITTFTDSLTDVMEASYSDEQIFERILFYRELLREPMIVNNQRFFSENEVTDPYDYTNDGFSFDEKLSTIEQFMVDRKGVIYNLMEVHFGYIR